MAASAGMDSAMESRSSHRIDPPIAIMGIPFDNVTLTDAIERIDAMIASRRPHYLVTANVDFLVQARADEELRRILVGADLVLCDGTPLVWMSRLLGNPLPERVAGADLVPQLIEHAAEKKHRLFFLGATPEANARAVARVQERHPGVIIAGHYSPPFKPLAEMDHAEISRRVRAAKPDILFVAFGCPKAEKWMAAHRHLLGVPVMIGVGATIDFLAGRMKRAPLWMQRGGLEWIYRLCQEPRRLGWRYLNDLWQFGRAIIGQWWLTVPALKGLLLKRRHCVVTSAPSWQRVLLPERLDADVVRHGEGIWRNALNRHCFLDLAGVRFIDSTGVGLLLRLQKQFYRAGKILVLLSPGDAVRRTLEQMRVRKFFNTVPTPLEAQRMMEPLLSAQVL
jgi:N-acetylglucosaminyldiphosphoundecaprenol N-acetyl-beta-D-mannosaminyltransferase